MKNFYGTAGYFAQGFDSGSSYSGPIMDRSKILKINRLSSNSEGSEDSEEIVESEETLELKDIEAVDVINASELSVPDDDFSKKMSKKRQKMKQMMNKQTERHNKYLSQNKRKH